MKPLLAFTYVFILLDDKEKKSEHVCYQFPLVRQIHTVLKYAHYTLLIVWMVFTTGQISAQRCVLEVKRYNKQLSKSVEAYVEEAVVRRELSDNYCFYQKNYDNLDGAYEWARKTLEDHRQVLEMIMWFIFFCLYCCFICSIKSQLNFVVIFLHVFAKALCNQVVSAVNNSHLLIYFMKD